MVRKASSKKTTLSPQRKRATTEFDRQIGMNIRLLRLQKKMTQEALAKALGGLSFQQIQKYEQGRNRLNGEKIGQLAAIFGVTVQALMTGNGNIGDVEGAGPPVIDRQAFLFMESFRSIEPRLRSILASLVDELRKRNPPPSM